jgi:hypothetical protein
LLARHDEAGVLYKVACEFVDFFLFHEPGKFQPVVKAALVTGVK